MFFYVNVLYWNNIFLMQKEEFQHTAYNTNAYVTVGSFAKQLLQGKGAALSKNMPACKHMKFLELLL